MQEIQIHDKYFVPFISAEEINKAITIMAQQIALDIGDEIPVFVGILNGSFMVVSDFMKQYKKACEVSFIKLSSYEGTTTKNQVQQLIGLNEDLKDKVVVVIEDIVDTGNTLVELKKMFEQRNVKQLKIATLFLKPEAYKKNIKIDYVGIEIPNKFIVGYGLDYDGLGRNIPAIYQVK